MLEVNDIGPAEESLFRLAQRAQCDNSIELVVLAGDQVYVDATAGLFDAGALLDQLDFAYERMFRNRGLQLLLRTSGIDLVPIIDDHEIEDNWEPIPPRGKKGPLRRSRQRYLDDQRAMWPGTPHLPADRFRPSARCMVSILPSPIRVPNAKGGVSETCSTRRS